MGISPALACSLSIVGHSSVMKGLQGISNYFALPTLEKSLAQVVCMRSKERCGSLYLAAKEDWGLH